MRAIIIILLVIGGFAFVGYRVYKVLTYSQAVIAEHDPAAKGKESIEQTKPQPLQTTEEKEEVPIFYSQEQVTQDPLLQRTFYQTSRGTLAGIAWKGGLVTAWTTDRRVISHSQVRAVGRDWVLLKTGALLRYPGPPPPKPEAVAAQPALAPGPASGQDEQTTGERQPLLLAPPAL